MSVNSLPLPSDPTWLLTFSDEFDAPAGTPPSPERWSHDLGGGGWGNRELQSYTDGATNAFHDGNGCLVIEARREPTTGPDGIARDYSSARILTKGKIEPRYGRIEARAKIPRGQGIWPAFWMLGADFPENPWPDCGEVDILESVGPVADIAYGTLHGPGYCGGKGITRQLKMPQPLTQGFHTYAVEWEPGEIRWYVDETCYSTVRPETVEGCPWPFDGPFFLLLNLAVGGEWPGYPDETTTFPQRLLVDHVRIYRRA